MKQVSAFIVLIFDIFRRVLGSNHSMDSFFSFRLGHGRGICIVDAFILSVVYVQIDYFYYLSKLLNEKIMKKK